MHSLRIVSVLAILAASSLVRNGAADTTSLLVTPTIVTIHHRISRPRRSENEDSSQSDRRRSIIAALDAYFGFQPPHNQGAGSAVSETINSKRSAMKDVAMDSENQRHSKKKDLIHGTVEMMMPAEGHENGTPKGAEMPVVVLTDDSAYGEMAMSEDEMKKMTKMVDHMLSDIMHSDLMKAFNMDSLPSVLNGHSSDFVHNIDHPMMDDYNHLHSTNNSHPAEDGFINNFATELNHLSPAGGNVATEVRQYQDTVLSASTASGVSAAAASNSFNPELQFTTLEVDLGPAILPLQVPEGYFVPFVPRKAFGVANGVARPPHGHASFYSHRPPGLVDVPNSPAFGFLFSGHSRSPDIEAAATAAPSR